MDRSNKLSCTPEDIRALREQARNLTDEECEHLSLAFNALAEVAGPAAYSLASLATVFQTTLAALASFPPDKRAQVQEWLASGEPLSGLIDVEVVFGARTPSKVEPWEDGEWTGENPEIDSPHYVGYHASVPAESGLGPVIDVMRGLGRESKCPRCQGSRHIDCPLGHSMLCPDCCQSGVLCDHPAHRVVEPALDHHDSAVCPHCRTAGVDVCARERAALGEG